MLAGKQNPVLWKSLPVFPRSIYHRINKRKKMCVLLPKVSIFISLGRGVLVDIKRATTSLNILQETMLPDFQTADGIY